MTGKVRVLGTAGGALGLGALAAAIGAGPPRPLLLMRQLSDLRGTQFPPLDSRIFARQVQTLLAQLPSLQSTAAHPNHARP